MVLHVKESGVLAQY